MEQVKTALFDFDGVVVDTESEYDVFWADMARKYNLGIDDFPARIKGRIMSEILATYFSQFPAEVHDRIRRACSDFEMQMDYRAIPGAIDFIGELKRCGVKIGLVTSSDDRKVAKASERLSLNGMFDVIVTADRITKGKPDPMCYLLAASDFGVSPDACVVFEDSFAGIRAGMNAGMTVVALSTTNPVSELKEITDVVIPDFTGIGFDTFKTW